MRSTMFQHRSAYSSPMFAGARIADGVLELRIRMPRPFASVFGLRHRSFPIAEIDAVDVVRHPISFRHRTHVVIGAETYQFSSWVGEELLRVAPRLRTSSPPGSS